MLYKLLCVVAVSLMAWMNVYGQPPVEHIHLRAALHELREARRWIQESKDVWPRGYQERALRSTQEAMSCIATILQVQNVDAFTGVTRGPDYYDQFQDHSRLRAAIKDLRDARHELSVASADFRGLRGRAIDLIDMAIGDCLTLIHYDRK